MDTPPDPHKKPSPAPELDAFERAAAAAEQALSRIHRRAEAVEEKFGMAEPAPEFWASKGDLAAEGGASSTLLGTAVAETGTFRTVPDPAVPDAAGGRDTETTEAPGKSKAKGPGKLARSTAFFSIATAGSRVAGLGREVISASYFGTTPQMSAFTIAFQVPNLIRALFADAALQPAFVPIFTEQVEKGKVKEAFRMASTLLLLVTMVLGAITAFFVLAAGLIMPVFSESFTPVIEHIMVVLSQIMFPILILLGITGVVVGILNSYDRFGAFAISPLFWNLTIIAVVVACVPLFPEETQIYAYAIGVVAGTVVQLVIPTWDLRNTPFRFTFKVDFRDPNVRRVLILMVPVTLSLGLINFNLLLSSYFGTLVSGEAPAAIDKAFRIFQLPQGIFSVAIATVLFPTLARFANRGDFDNLRKTLAKGMRQIAFVLLPATAAILVLAEPMTRVVFERGEFGPDATEMVSTALFWFALALPTNGMFLLLSRTFFGLQQPWIPTAIAGGNLAVTAIACALLYKPFGIAGIVAGTSIATTVAVIAQVVLLRPRIGGIEAPAFIFSTVRILIGSAVLALVSYEAWDVVDHYVGRGLIGQIVSLTVGLGLGGIAYVAVCQILRVPELQQISNLVRRRAS